MIDKSIEAGNLFWALKEQAIPLFVPIKTAFEQRCYSDVDSDRFAAYAHILSNNESFDPRYLDLKVPSTALADAALISSDETLEPHETAASDNELFEAESEFDPVLLEIFTKEATGLIATIQQCISQCHEEHDECEPVQDLIRSLHTLRGSSHMSEIMPIGDVSQELEKIVKLIAEKGQKLNSGFLELLDESCSFFEKIISQLNENPLQLESHAALLDSTRDFTDWAKNLPNLLEAVDVDEQLSITPEKLAHDVGERAIEEIDGAFTLEETTEEELSEIFRQEAIDLLTSCQSAIKLLQDDPQDSTALTQLIRDVHTLKGGSKLAGVEIMGDLAGSFETQLEHIKQDKVPLNALHLEVFQEVYDELITMLDAFSNQADMSPSSAVIARLENLLLLEDSPDDLAPEDPALEDNVFEAQTEEISEIETSDIPDQVEENNIVSAAESELSDEEPQTHAETSSEDNELLEIFLEESLE